jgi:hypothetical protein
METWWQPAAGQFLPRSSMSIGEGESSKKDSNLSLTGGFFDFFCLLYSTVLHLPIYHYMTLCLCKMGGGGIDRPPFKMGSRETACPVPIFELFSGHK